MTSNQLFIFGLHSVEALLLKQPDRVLRICVQKERRDDKIDRLIELAQNQKIQIEQVPKLDLERITSEGNHQGILAYCKPAHVYGERDLPFFISGY